jgi:tetratricopeptide (TPR) repeat protein
MKIALIAIVSIIGWLIALKILPFILKIFWPKKARQYWLGEGMRYIKEKKPKKALVVLNKVLNIKPKDPEDQDWKATYCVATYYLGLAYVGLGNYYLARQCLTITEKLNPHNNKLVDDLRETIEMAERIREERELPRKQAFYAALEKEELKSGEGVLIARGYREMESTSLEQAIKTFNEVLILQPADYQMKGKDNEEHVSLALLGLVLSYSGLGQFDNAKEYLGILERINPDMAEEFRETWRKSPPHS